MYKRQVKWNYDQQIEVGNQGFPNPEYVLIDDVYHLEYKIYVNDQPPALPLDHVSTLTNSFKMWEDMEFNANDGKKVFKLQVANTGDRPIQVGSHTHFAEANKALEFNREKSLGFHLNIPAGTSIRFEPGESKHVQIVEFGGTKTIYGFSGMVGGELESKRDSAIKNLHEHEFKSSLDDVNEQSNSLEIPRSRYVELFGPTVGDKVRLADTDLIMEIEKDLIKYGDELVFGGGKSARDGLGQASGVLRKDSADLVITNAMILDPVLGIIKADIGIKDGKILAIGNAGNPDVMDDIDIVVSSNTEIISGEHTICTPGTIDSHIHFISPQQAIDAICNGTTTMIGGGTGPADGTNATTCTPGAVSYTHLTLPTILLV